MLADWRSCCSRVGRAISQAWGREITSHRGQHRAVKDPARTNKFFPADIAKGFRSQGFTGTKKLPEIKAFGGRNLKPRIAGASAGAPAPAPGRASWRQPTFPPAAGRQPSSGTPAKPRHLHSAAKLNRHRRLRRKPQGTRAVAGVARAAADVCRSPPAPVLSSAEHETKKKKA